VECRDWPRSRVNWVRFSEVAHACRGVRDFGFVLGAEEGLRVRVKRGCRRFLDEGKRGGELVLGERGDRGLGGSEEGSEVGLSEERRRRLYG